MLTRDGSIWAVLMAVGIGAMAGAWLRWALSLWLNSPTTFMPWGTLIANLIGGYLIGVVVALLAAHPGVSPLWRLLLVTGFLGGLTTFSSFSIESVSMLSHGRWAAAAAHSAAHLFGSLLATAAGLWTVRGGLH